MEALVEVLDGTRTFRFARTATTTSSPWM